MRRFASFSEQEYKHRADAKHNINRHQFGNSECGMYSLNVILRLLEGGNFEAVCTENIKDDIVNNLRPIFFANVDKDFSQIKI